MRRRFLPISCLLGEPYSAVLGFPRATKRQLRARARELGSLGVGKISFWGQTQLGILRVLGKGHVGVVVLGRWSGGGGGCRTVAVKIRRTDSQRASLAGESALLRKANGAGVGPRFLAGSRNFLVMEYLKGRRISDWAAGLGGRGAAAEAKAVLGAVLDDCFRLDMRGIDHGELSVISKHVVVGRKAAVVDFESASTGRRASNITSAAQSVYIGSGIAKRVARIYRVPPRQEIIGALRRYKRDPSLENYNALRAVLRLQRAAGAPPGAGLPRRPGGGARALQDPGRFLGSTTRRLGPDGAAAERTAAPFRRRGGRPR